MTTLPVYGAPRQPNQAVKAAHEECQRVWDRANSEGVMPETIRLLEAAGKKTGKGSS